MINQVLQIWIGETPPKELKDAMTGVKNLAGDKIFTLDDDPNCA